MQKNQNTMPLLAAMLQYKKEQVYPFHTPGHKGGRGMETTLQTQLGLEALKMDVSLMAELDDLHSPIGCLAQAQDLAAQLYGSDRCFFAVNGTSQAIQAMLMLAVKAKGKVLVPRNSHRSVAAGLLLADLQPVYITPLFDVHFGINTQVTPDQIEAALKMDKDIQAVFLTSPNYYGQAADVTQIAKITHKYGAVLLVDEAHGPHLGFCKELPSSALQCGADATSQSTHKIVGAMTQCSLLHVQGKHLNLEKAADVMSLLTTTSPNYLLMASLDAARFQLGTQGEEMCKAALQAALQLTELFAMFPEVIVLDKSCVGKNGVAGFDPTKVTVNVKNLGYTGTEASELLRQAGIAVELTDAYNVMFLVTYSDKGESYRLALEKIKNVFLKMQKDKKKIAQDLIEQKVPAPEVVISLKTAFDSRKTSIDLRDSEGEICAEQVSFYPPGIPVLLPGEKITKEIINYCMAMKAMGLPVSGPIDSSLEKIRVVLA